MTKIFVIMDAAENIKLLKSLGLSTREIQVYLATIESGPAAASVIARTAREQRQTTYSVLLSLVEMGIVRISDRGSVKRFSADPRELLTFLDQKREGLQQITDELEKQIPELLALRGADSNIPKVVYYEGEDGLRLLMQHILDYYKAGGEKLFRAYGVNKFHGTLKNYLYRFVQERAKYNVDTRLFIGKGPNDFGIIDKKTALGRMIKQLNMDPQSAGVYIVGNRLFLFSYKDNVGVMVQNDSIVSLLTAVFDDQWERVRK
jgi:sugar-specific transcriptional regulator TrmB